MTAAQGASRDAQTSRPRRRRLGEILVDQGLLTQEELAGALARQRQGKEGRLGRVIVDMGLATETQITEAVAEQLRIPGIDLAAVEIPAEDLARVDAALALKHSCLPWFVDGHNLHLIMADPTDLAAIDAVAFHTGLNVKPVMANESEVQAALERHYATAESSLAQFENLDLADQLSVVVETETEGATEPTLADVSADEAPVVKLVNAILVDAIAAGASDIHLEPQAKSVLLRYRVDGRLRQVMTMPRRIHPKLISRVKVMSHMDIAERRLPQDGRTFIRMGGKSYDFRVSTLPTAEGEKVVGRLLLQERAEVALEELGFSPDVLEAYRGLLRRPQGMILVTGPTGSGKSSTLYASLNQLRTETSNVVTIEDPVEFRLQGVNQVAVSPKAGLTFAAGLRSILRQDPDVVMVGEIRDLETAQIAFQAAQTGHLVLSTLHTNDAPSAVTRLVEMGLPAYVVASSLIGVLAQRLVLKLCQCKSPQPDGTARPQGCDLCRYSGFKGRVGVFELMRVTPRVSGVLVARATNDVMRRAALAGGMRSMFADGLQKVAGGITTLEEVTRVVPADEADEAPAEPGIGLDQEATATNAALSGRGVSQRRPRILVVDDDSALVEVLTDILEEANHEVLSASNGHEAMALVHRQHPDLVITDLRMPEVDGLGLLRALRRDLSTCLIPVLFLTVVGDLESEVKALDLGADDYIGKPVDRARLLSRVRRALIRAHLMT
jgi:type IV pilus assembly protein PilB